MMAVNTTSLAARLVPPLTMGMTILGTVGCERPSQDGGFGVVPVERRDIVVAASAAGTVEPITTVEVKSKASGEIIGVLVEEGETVEPGQLLVRVDPRIPQNAVIQAEADSVVARAELDNAEAQWDRAERLHATASITDLEYETARLARASAYARLISARRALEDAKIAYEDTEVRAATRGVILGRSVEIGTVIASASRDVSGGAVLMRMASLDTVQVRALVDETDIGMIKPDMSVSIRVEAYPNHLFTGQVLRIGAEALVQQNVTMFPVLVRIANEEALLRPGMNAEVDVHIGEVRNALAIPNAALRNLDEVETAANVLGVPMEIVREQLAKARDPEGLSPERGQPDGVAPRQGAERRSPSGAGRMSMQHSESLFGGSYVVFVLEDGVPCAAPIETGLTDFDYTAVLNGLTEGDSVIILPTAGLIEDLQRREERIRERVSGPLSTQGRR
jgi:HlyD family secretion protein